MKQQCGERQNDRFQNDDMAKSKTMRFQNDNAARDKTIVFKTIEMEHTNPSGFKMTIRRLFCGKTEYVMNMENKKELPKRKHPRLDYYDYSSTGAYYVTICTQNRRCVLSRIAETNEIEYTTFGKIAEKQLLSLKDRYPCLSVDRYVIMPNHIHVILVLNNAVEASLRHTIIDMICAYKSLTTKECKKVGLDGKLFQTSFYEHIIRDREEYGEIVKYIQDNPTRWYYDKLYAEE